MVPVTDTISIVSQPELKIPPRDGGPQDKPPPGVQAVVTGTKKSPALGFDWKLPTADNTSIPTKPCPVPLILKYFYSPSACHQSCTGTIELLKRTLNSFPGQNIRLYFINMDISLGAMRLAQIYRSGTLASYTFTRAEEELDRVEGPRPSQSRRYYERFIANSLRLQKHKMTRFWTEENKNKKFLSKMAYFYNAAPAQWVGVPGRMERYSKEMFGDPWDNYNWGVPKVVEVAKYMQN